MFLREFLLASGIMALFLLVGAAQLAILYVLVKVVKMAWGA